MNDFDKIIAAIFAANMLTGKSADHAAYLDAYDQFIDLMERRKKAEHKPMNISPEVLEQVRNMPKRRR
jgi:hypothetical protein